MKLLLRRSQAKSRLGTTRFQLWTRFEVSDEELELIDQCNLMNESLAQLLREENTKTLTDSVWAMKENKRLTVGKLVTGVEIVTDHLGDMLDIEDSLKQSSLNVQRYLEIAASYGGEEVIDITALLEAEV